VNSYDAEFGRVDWLDLGPDPDLDSPPSGPQRWRWWGGLGVAVVVAALLLTRTQHGSTKQQASRPSQSVAPTPSTSSRPTPRAPSSYPTSRPIPSRVTVSKLGHQLFDVPPDWELFGQGPGVVVRIQLALGRVTKTPVPDLRSSGPVSFVVGADRALIDPLDEVPGYVVADGKKATELPAAIGQAGSLLPGPDSHHFWKQSGDSVHPVLSLIGLDGSPSGVKIAVPPTAAVGFSDGAGGMVMYGIGGMYDLGPDGAHRITSGTLLAVGPTRWLTAECDDRYHCTTVVIDRSSDARETLETPVGNYQQDVGRISPDGGTSAMLVSDAASGSASIHLLNLSTGADRSTGLTIGSDLSFGGGTFVWSPDGRWLFVTDGSGDLAAVDRSSGKITDLGVQVGEIDQLAFRSKSR
jgi:hypothetical protein